MKGLKENLEKINNLDPDKIREVYRAMLQDSNIGHKGGAGLGLMEMARKTGNKLDYDFFPSMRNIPISSSARRLMPEERVHQSGMRTLPFNGRRAMLLERMMKSNRSTSSGPGR